MQEVPSIRIRKTNDQPVNEKGEYVLYWMIAFRRTGWNFALQRAVEQARELNRPLLILEALRCDYPWASDRLHAFILQGMADNARRLASRPALYHPYVEPEKGAGKGLLLALAEPACLVVTDDFPAFFLPHMIKAAAGKLPVLLEAVDSNGLLPLRAAERDYPSAYAFRRFLQKELRGHLNELPGKDPLQGAGLPMLKQLPAAIARCWPAASPDLLAAKPEALAKLPLDHGVAVAPVTGGTLAARRQLTRFLDERLADYAEHRNEPEREVTSELSAHLHFGHLSVHEIFDRLSERENWSIGDLSPDAKGKREGWWGMSRPAEAFLDQLVTWRELGYNCCAFRTDYQHFASLPDWARQTLEEHESDPRPYLYTLEEFERSATHDPLWNAAQLQLVREGKMHNYLRMLWGKKILEWTRTPRAALEVMTELNNKYALDGRDPNSYSGIFWCLGRYDRPWGPERPIFGKIRYMSSENTARKFPLGRYLRRYTP
ncbi:deoxyribodipyrimidine photo-lyase [Desulfuromonas versatilis]|uniref:Deoxyribodipyrimidine photo-lyase n=1 Tax=Desulfuromonas versatilis TaxID=2802975 RepID=A0ABN6DX67_9BACT|nr:deoxyribodipyrimidine photolyase [Desulfuromonas versatilis]BCR03814.1 deoxyribodipyrimidine photo-lyase [Desulfuromonas versatilis]